jgi:uncharacterized protein YukE
MGQAIVDPAELRRFAQTLKRFNSDLQDRTTALSVELSHLSATWRDQENKKFCEEFQQHLKYLARFNDSIEQHIPYLLRKAESIEEYLEQR